MERGIDVTQLDEGRMILTDAEIAEIEARAEKATKGPWRRRQERMGSFGEQSWVEAPNAIIPNDRGPQSATQILADDDYKTKKQDELFIARVRTDIPALIASHRLLMAVARAAKKFDKHPGDEKAWRELGETLRAAGMGGGDE